MEWPWRRFLKAFDSFQRRTLCDEWKTRKTAHLAALFSNTNLDDERNDRPAIMQKLEEAYDDIVARIWNGADAEASEEEAANEAAWDSPFMRAGRTQLQMVNASAANVPRPVPPRLPGEAAIGALPR